VTGGEALARMFKAAGAGPMFGMGGFQALPFYDAARRLNLVHHLVNDERSGGFAADAYARVTGRPGLCDGTLGPGATNLVTALTESLNAGIPVVALATDTHRAHSWKNMTQECRQVEILRPAVKALIRVERIERIPELARRAFALATSGRPGPVLLDVPEDVLHGEHAFADTEFWTEEATRRIPARRSRPAPEDLSRAAAALQASRRPLLLAGGGVHLSRAYAALDELVRQESIPVAHTMSGKGALACNDGLSVGLFGRFDRIANRLIAESDCILVAGCKLGEIATKRFTLFAPQTPLIHIELQPEDIGGTTPVRIGLCGDLREALRDLAQALLPGAMTRRAAREVYLNDVRSRMEEWRQASQARYTSAESPVHMARLIAELREALPADATLVADGGFAAHWTGLLYDTRTAGRTYVANRGMASIGYGLPGAIGAKLGRPHAKVAALTGDGGFNMTLGDLEMARRVGAEVMVVVVNNAASGYVKSLQHALYGPGSYQSSDLIEMNYSRIAQAMGCHGFRVERPEDLGPAFRQALSVTGAPAVVDVMVTRDPSQMLPAADNRTLTVSKGDRPV
jgi:acetolactate synthase-1/2/3 large subunit